MSVQGPDVEAALAHCQVAELMLPSGSDSVAASSVPAWGCAVGSVTVPASSTSSILMMTVIVARRLPGSVAVTVTSCLALVSWSSAAAVLIWPVEESIANDAASAPESV